MDKRPIGVFDSGMGGLTAVRQLQVMLPGEDIVYFGDTGRVPYGSRSKAVSYTHLTLPTTKRWCRSRWSPYH